MEIRPIRDESDLERVVETINAVYPDDQIGVTDFVAWGAQARERVDLVAERDGAIIGASRSFLEAQRPNPWLHIWVAPGSRRQGAGSALFVGASRWAAEVGASRFEAWIREDSAPSIAFAKSLGFEETGRERSLFLDLVASEPPAVEPPEGVELTTWAEHPELAPGLYEAYVEAIPDIPGEEEAEIETFDGWLKRDMQSAGDRADATFVALAREEVAGYAKLAFTSVQLTTAYHDLTAIKRVWRGRGIARALKAMQIRWCMENGYEELRTRNEERNKPIRRLNERFGYQPGGGRIYLRGPVA